MASPAFELQPALDQAVAAYRAGQYVEAEQICQKIVSRQGGAFEVLYVLAVVQAMLGKHDLALQHYNRALALQPHHAEALSNRGNTLKALKRLEAALDSFDEAIAVQPNYALALTNRGTVLFDLKRYDDALASYDRSLAIRPDHAETFITAPVPCMRSSATRRPSRTTTKPSCCDPSLPRPMRTAEIHSTN